VADIQSCLEKAIKNNNKKDIKYFSELKDRGYIYVSLDGNHRTQMMWNDKNNMSKYTHQNIEVVIYMYLSIVEMHEYARRKNLQKPWNRNELRNSIVSSVSDFIRETSNEFIETTDKLKIKTDRYQNQEFMSSLLLLLVSKYQNRPYIVTQKELFKLYELPISDNLFNRFKSIMELWSHVITKLKVSKKPRKMFLVTLFMICDHILSTSPELINEEYLDHLVSKFAFIVKDLEDNYIIDPWWNSIFDLTRRQTYSYINERVEYFLKHIYTNE
jgi:hypothetical protein